MRVHLVASLAVMSAGIGWAAPAAAATGDWGCQVLLCLSNPGGPTQYGACVPPISKLWRSLAKGEAFPTCAGAGVSDIKVHHKDNTSSRYVTMSFADGTKKYYSLANIEYAGALLVTDGGSGADRP